MAEMLLREEASATEMAAMLLREKAMTAERDDDRRRARAAAAEMAVMLLRERAGIALHNNGHHDADQEAPATGGAGGGDVLSAEQVKRQRMKKAWIDAHVACREQHLGGKAAGGWSA